MDRLAFRLGTLVVAFVAFARPASAQITWNVTFTGSGWNDSTPIGGTTVGQARRDSINAATAYLSTIVDGRGTVNLTFDGSLAGGNGSGLPLAFFGPNKFVNFGDGSGSFQNGGIYHAARTNDPVFTGADGDGTFFFGYGWNYDGQTPSGSNFDMVTTAIHEIGHGLGFLSAMNPDGSGFGNPPPPPGVPGRYAEFDRFLQRGNGTTGQLFSTDINSSTFGTFNGPVSTLTNGENPDVSVRLHFGGKYAREVFGGPIPIYSPNPFEDGSSLSHVTDGDAVMSPTIAPAVVQRFLRYEIAMLLDIGWNVYNWNNSTGNWGDGTTDVTQSRWRTDQGIITNSSFDRFNTFGHTDQAPVLPPYAQVTSNIVLNFGTGTNQYTATNTLGSLRIARLNLNSANANHTNTITGGTLQFGVNSDGTASVLTPKIVQQNAGAFIINSDLVITNTTGAVGGGWTGLTVDGTGSGKVTLGGVISGDGTLTKAGTFTLELTGSAANTYTGLTTISGGTLIANKTSGDAVSGDLTIATGGTLLLGASNQLQGGSGAGRKFTLSGGTMDMGAGFSDSVGTFELTASSTIDLGSGVHELRFAGITGTPTGTLTVLDWAGTEGNFGTQGKLIFVGMGSDPNADFSSFLQTVQFQTYSTGASFLFTGESGVYELVPVPEPATVLAIAFGALAAGAALRRRLRKSVVHALSV